MGSTNALPAGTRVKQTRLASTLLKNMWDAWEPTLAEELRADECRYPPTDGSPVPKPAECAASAAATAAKQSHKAAVAASELHAMAAEGRGGDEAAIDEFVRLVLEPNSVKFFNLPCFRRCGDAPVCEYCGTNLCCRRGYRGYRNGAGDICRGHGGSSHRCTVIPEIDRNATAKAQYARALAARLILATNATQYPAPVDFSQLDEQLGLRAPAAADDAEASRSGKLSDPASAKAAASGIPSSAHGSKLKRLRAVGFPALVDELPEECRGPRNGVARWLSCRDLQPHHGGDLELPGQLEAAVAARSWRPGQGERRELVLTYANEIGTAWVSHGPRYTRRALVEAYPTRVRLHPASIRTLLIVFPLAALAIRVVFLWYCRMDVHASWVLRGCPASLHWKSSGLEPVLRLPCFGQVANMVLSLRSVGIEHSLVISTSGTHCDALFSSPQRISCGWTSWQVRLLCSRNSPAAGQHCVGPTRARVFGAACDSAVASCSLAFDRCLGAPARMRCARFGICAITTWCVSLPSASTPWLSTATLHCRVIHTQCSKRCRCHATPYSTRSTTATCVTRSTLDSCIATTALMVAGEPLAMFDPPTRRVECSHPAIYPSSGRP